MTDFVLTIKTEGDPATLGAAVREAVREVDPEQPVFDLKTMSQRVDEVSQNRRAPMLLFSLFSGVSLLLAVLGVYGVLSFAVARRTTEFGVRVALGATGSDIAKLVLRQGVWFVCLGVAGGLAGYLALSHLIGRMLYGIAPTDPRTLLLAPLLLGATALLACWLPARRATRVDPMVALRSE